MPTKSRIPYLDFIKFIAIASVLLGHSVEHVSGNGFWDNPLWSFIYAWHMPLFMMLSGYFFGSSLRLPFHQLVAKKGLQLIVPCVTMFLLMYAIVAVLGFNPCPEMLDFSVTGFANCLWFLKCVFLCYLIAYCAMKLFGGKMIPAAVLTTVVVSVVPGCDVVNLNFMLPMFWMGYALNLFREAVDRHRKPLLVVSAVAFFGMLWFWNGWLTVYSVPIAFVRFSDWSIDTHNLAIAVFRLAIGVAGSLTIFLAAPWLYTRVENTRFGRLATEIGKATLGIYVVQTLLLETLIHSLGYSLGVVEALEVAPLIAVVEMAVCYGVVVAVRKSSVGRLLLFGERTAASRRPDLGLEKA